MHAIFDMINLDNLTVIGNGSNNVCLTDGVYAIKIGNNNTDEYETMNRAYDHGLSVKPYNHAIGVELPEQIITALIAKYGENTSEYAVYPIIERKRANVLITDLATPIMPNYGESYTAELYHHAREIMRDLEFKFRMLMNEIWYDPHVWNIAMYNGNPVIIDF